MAGQSALAQLEGYHLGVHYRIGEPSHLGEAPVNLAAISLLAPHSLRPVPGMLQEVDIAESVESIWKMLVDICHLVALVAAPQTRCKNVRTMRQAWGMNWFTLAKLGGPGLASVVSHYRSY